METQGRGSRFWKLELPQNLQQLTDPQIRDGNFPRISLLGRMRLRVLMLPLIPLAYFPGMLVMCFDGLFCTVRWEHRSPGERMTFRKPYRSVCGLALAGAERCADAVPGGRAYDGNGGGTWSPFISPT